MDPLTSVGRAGAIGLAGAVSSSAVAGGQDFFRLIHAQLTSQNPLEPMEGTEFMGQLAQYSQLEEAAGTNRRLDTMVLLQESLAALQQMTQSTQLLGQEVEYLDDEGELQSGTVQAVRVEDGVVVADIDGQLVPLTRLRAVLGSLDDTGDSE